jgi:hypothetical protein
MNALATKPGQVELTHLRWVDSLRRRTDRGEWVVMRIIVLLLDELYNLLIQK